MAMLPVIGVLQIGRVERDVLDRSTRRLAAIVLLALLSLAVVPSKWSYHLGAMAPLFAAFLTVAVAQVVRQGRRAPRDPRTLAVGAVGAVLVAAAAALTFDGPNAWWLPALYDVAWASGPTRPLNIPANATLFWITMLAGGIAAGTVLGRTSIRRMVSIGPALLVGLTTMVVLTLLLGSFLLAPLRRSSGSLAMTNLHRLTGGPPCGLADDVEVLPDGAVLSVAERTGAVEEGFHFLGGFLPTAPPPDPLGTGASRALWGSWAGAQSTGTLISPWFALPTLGPQGGIAVSVAGRTDGANSLAFEFGATSGDGVIPRGQRRPMDRVAPDEDPAHPLWRTIGIDASDVPAGVDRVRLRAVADRSDSIGWLAVTGPRLRSIIGLDQFLAGRGPVLVAWPLAFLFPCVRNTPIVVDGLAQTPNVLIAAPRPRVDQERDPYIGGTFAELDEFGELGEVPTRLRGHPDLDWGSLFVSRDPEARDAYQRSITRSTRSGLDATGNSPPEH